MTSSSFQNIVGTPRDAIPDISKTNYLETGVDLTEAINEGIDDQIKDRSEFFDQMVEIEELAASKFNKRLNAITSIVSSGTSIYKSIKAKQDADADNSYGTQTQEAVIDAIEGDDGAEEEQKEKVKFQESQLDDQLNTDKKTGEITATEYNEINLGIPTLAKDGRKNKEFVNESIIPKLDLIDEDLTRKNSYDLNTVLEFQDSQKKSLVAFYGAVGRYARAAGYDTSDPRFQKQLIKLTAKLVKSKLENQSREFLYSLREKVQEEKSYEFRTGAIEAVQNLNKFKKDGTRVNTNFFKDGGFIHQTSLREGVTRSQARDKVLDIVGKLVKEGKISTEDAKTIYQDIPYTDPNGKEFKNLEEYIEKQTDGTPFKARVSASVQKLSNTIVDKQIETIQLQKTTNAVQLHNFIKSDIEPLKEASENGTLETSQIASAYNKLINSDFYIKGETKIPAILQSMHNKTHTGGVRDKNVLIVGELSADINQALKDVDLFYRQHKTLDAKIDLGLDDTNAVRRLQAEFKTLLYGENGKDLDTLKMAIGSGQYTFQQRVDEIFANMKPRIDSIIEPPPIVPLGQATRNVLELRAQVNENRDLLYSKTPLKGEDVDSLFDFLNTGGQRNKELQNFYKNARFRVIEDDGSVRVLSGYEAAEVRGKELGIYDQKGKKLMNFNAKILKDYKAVNDVENKTTASKVLRAFSDGKGEQMTEFLTQHAVNRSGINSEEQATTQVQDTSYTYKSRSGFTSPRQGITRMNGARIVALAERGSTDFGRYHLSNENILLLHSNGMIDLTKDFTEDQQSLAVVNLMGLNANRTNSISGAITKDTENFRKLTNFSSDELEVIKQIFPNLSENYFAQFQTLEAEVAQLILSDLEKYQQQIATERQKKKDEKEAEKLRRSKLSKRELRGR